MVTKAQLRQSVRNARAARLPEEREQAALDLRDQALRQPAVLNAKTVTCFLDATGEPGTGPLRAALTAAGVRILLPITIVEAGEPALTWAVDDGNYEPSGFRDVWQPAGPRLGTDAVSTVDLAFVPGLAVDTNGYRLGQGGGYYDRTIPKIPPGVFVVAMLFDDELLDACVSGVPHVEHDQKVDAVLTPSRWVWVGPGR